MGETTNACKMFVGNSEGKRDLSKFSGLGGRIILKWILRKQGRRVWTRFMWVVIGTGCGLLLSR
jgi:hypothetical protein